MNPDIINAIITFAGTLVLAAVSFLLKRLLVRIDGIDGRLIALDAMTQAKILNLDQANQARITSVEQVADAKIRDCHAARSNREDSIVRMVVEHAKEADRKYATVRELLTVQERLLAIDNNVRAVLAVLERFTARAGRHD